MLKQLALSMACIFGFIGVSHAEQAPQVLGDDSRVQYFKYDPNTVYPVKAKMGYSTLVQLDEGEEVTENGGLGMGDSQAWNLAVKGNNIFFKPIQENADTNIVLVTNKRTYAFVLSMQPPESNDTTYIVRFIYPAEKVATPATTEQKQENKPTMPTSLQVAYTDVNGNQLLIDSDVNTQYEYRGAELLKPTNAWDNGRFTYIRYNHGMDIPTVYRVLPDKTEAIVNTHIEQDTIVLQEVGKNYRLRFGKAVGELRTKAVNNSKFNTTGTSANDYVRVVQGE